MSFAPQNIVILGASGAIGRSVTALVAQKYPAACVLPFSRDGEYRIDYDC